jgi:hypothetical protein
MAKRRRRAEVKPAGAADNATTEAAARPVGAQPRREALWLLLLCVAATALTAAGLAWLGRPLSWSLVLAGLGLSLVLLHAWGKKAPLRGRRWLAVGGAMVGMSALFAAAAGSWFARSVWRVAPQPGPYALLRGCTCNSQRGLVELKLAIQGASSGDGSLQGRWALSVNGTELALRTRPDTGAPRTQLTVGGQRLHTAMACMEQGVLLAQGDSASLWSWEGRPIASTLLPARLSSSAELKPLEGYCTVLEPSAGSVVLPAEGRAVRVLSSGIVLVAE